MGKTEYQYLPRHVDPGQCAVGALARYVMVTFAPNDIVSELSARYHRYLPLPRPTFIPGQRETLRKRSVFAIPVRPGLLPRAARKEVDEAKKRSKNANTRRSVNKYKNIVKKGRFVYTIE